MFYVTTEWQSKLSDGSWMTAEERVFNKNIAIEIGIASNNKGNF